MQAEGPHDYIRHDVPQVVVCKVPKVLLSHNATPSKQESKGHQQRPWFLNIMPELNGTAVSLQCLVIKEMFCTQP